MARTLAEVNYATLLCVLFTVRSTAEVCPNVAANHSCRDTFILQTNGTVAFECVTDYQRSSKWWKNNQNGCILFGTLDKKPPNHKAILHDNFTLQLYNLAYEDIATYKCIVFDDIVASSCVGVMPDLSIVYKSMIVDEDTSITIFERDEFNITCNTGPAYPAIKLSWILNEMQYLSKTVENENGDNTANYSTTLVEQFLSVTRVNISCLCRSSKNLQPVIKSVVVNVNVLPILRITVNGKNVSGKFVAEVGQEFTIECIAYGGRPPVNLTWKEDERRNQMEKTTVSVNAFNTDTVDTKLSLEDTIYGIGDHNITCSSFGMYPEQKATFTLFIEIHDIVAQTKWRLWLFSILPITFALFLLVVLRLACERRTRKLDTDKPRSDWRNYERQDNWHISTYGEDGLTSLPLMRTQTKGSDEEEELPTDVKRDEISMMTTLPGRSYLQYFRGSFNKSGKALYIIVKTVKEQAFVKDMYNFVKCCDLMQCLPRRENIVTLLGISVGEMPIYSYHEYVEGLTLRDYMLRNFQSSSLSTTSASLSHSIEKEASISTKELYVFAENVASGMDFLVSHNFSHPALSTRKVLLGTNGRCKLYDIWPDILVVERMRYLLNRESPPLAWMAPECIFLGQYHPTTDVWSYGVVLWELFSFGETPYYTMNNSEIEQELRNSRHLAIPPNCPGSIFSVMLSSWNKEWEQRPTFEQISHQLRCLLEGLLQKPITKSATRIVMNIHHLLKNDHEWPLTKVNLVLVQRCRKCFGVTPFLARNRSRMLAEKNSRELLFIFWTGQIPLLAFQLGLERKSCTNCCFGVCLHVIPVSLILSMRYLYIRTVYTSQCCVVQPNVKPRYNLNLFTSLQNGTGQKVRDR